MSTHLNMLAMKLELIVYTLLKPTFSPYAIKNIKNFYKYVLFSDYIIWKIMWKISVKYFPQFWKFRLFAFFKIVSNVEINLFVQKAL